MANSDLNDFGKEVGLLHKVLVAGRNVGADREFWIRLSEDKELFKNVVSLVNGLPNSNPVYTVTLNDTLSHQAMITAGRYDWVNDKITQKLPQDLANPQSNGSDDSYRGSQEVELHLVHFRREMATHNVLQGLDKRGLRPANFRELCALGATCPELQCKFLIIALGSQWRDSDGFVSVPMLHQQDRKRHLTLDSDNSTDKWRGICRFLAVRK